MKTCDLHTHSTASDGSDTPSELIHLAKEADLAAIALSDHDTVDGLVEAEREARSIGMEFIPAVELSCQFHKGNMHLLGYYIDMKDQEFLKVLARVQAARAERNPKILAKLQELGISITMEELKEMASGGQIGRPHIARALVKKGAVRDVGQAFEKYLKRGGKAYAPKSILSPAEAISAVLKAGGIPVLAHPFSLKADTTEELQSIIIDLKSKGLQGVECIYSEHSPEFTQQLIQITRALDLAVTGGSDYHGKAKPYIKLGRGKGSLTIPYSCVEELKAIRDERS